MSSKNWLAGVSYDLNGNALAVNAFALTYVAENRQATATSGSAVESYFYDENNHRVEKIFGSSDYIYFYGPGGRLLSIREVTNGPTSVVADRVYFGGLLLGSAGNGPSYDVSTMTDRLGTAVAGYPYGTDIGSFSAGNDQADFATYTRDSTTGFEYANQRYYSAGLGRFLTADPFAGSARVTSPSSWNRYAYASGDPVGRSDRFGTCNESDNFDLTSNQTTLCATADYVDTYETTAYEVLSDDHGSSAQTDLDARGDPSYRKNGNTDWTAAKKRLVNAAQLVLALIASNDLPPDCLKDFSGLLDSQEAITAGAVSSHLNDVVADGGFRDMQNSTDSYNLANPYVPMHSTSTMGGLWIYSPGTGAQSQAGEQRPNGKLGNLIWFDPTYVNQSSMSAGSLAGLVLHEVLHNFGIMDPELETAVGIATYTSRTEVINIKLTADCFPGK